MNKIRIIHWWWDLDKPVIVVAILLICWIIKLIHG